MSKTDSTKASNADVLAKYGRTAIMVRAWRTFKTAAMVLKPVTFAAALRSAWEGFRTAIDRIATDKAVVASVVAKGAARNPHGLMARIKNNPTATRDAWGRNSSRYLNTVMGA